MIHTQNNTWNPFKDLGRGVCGQSSCVTLPYVSHRKELKTNGCKYKVCAPSHLQLDPQSAKILWPFRSAASMNAPCVRMNLGLYSGLLMSSDTNSYPLQMDQVVCKILTWINPSRARKDLQGKQKLALNMCNSGRRARLAPNLVPKFGLPIYALF